MHCQWLELGTRLSCLEQVVWGEFTMVVAMRLLLRAAISNPSNQRFVYACEKTLPLYPATLVYQQLMGENKSRISACSRIEQTNNVVLLSPCLAMSALAFNLPPPPPRAAALTMTSQALESNFCTLTPPTSVRDFHGS